MHSTCNYQVWHVVLYWLVPSPCYRSLFQARLSSKFFQRGSGPHQLSCNTLIVTGRLVLSMCRMLALPYVCWLDRDLVLQAHIEESDEEV